MPRAHLGEQFVVDGGAAGDLLEHRCAATCRANREPSRRSARPPSRRRDYEGHVGR